MAYYKNVIFDLDGTLTNSKPGIINAALYALYSSVYYAYDAYLYAYAAYEVLSNATYWFSRPEFSWYQM